MSFSAWVNKWIFQMAHVGWGMSIAMFLGAVYNPLLGFSALAGFAGLKEFVFDPLTEDKALSGGWAGDAKDFGFWIAGGAVGAILAFIIHLTYFV